MEGVLEIGKASWSIVGIVSLRTSEKPNMGKSEVIGLFIEQGGNMNSAVDLLNTTKE